MIFLLVHLKTASLRVSPFVSWRLAKQPQSYICFFGIWLTSTTFNLMLLWHRFFRTMRTYQLITQNWTDIIFRDQAPAQLCLLPVRNLKCNHYSLYIPPGLRHIIGTYKITWQCCCQIQESTLVRLHPSNSEYSKTLQRATNPPGEQFAFRRIRSPCSYHLSVLLYIKQSLRPSHTAGFGKD